MYSYDYWMHVYKILRKKVFNYCCIFVFILFFIRILLCYIMTGLVMSLFLAFLMWKEINCFWTLIFFIFSENLAIQGIAKLQHRKLAQLSREEQYELLLRKFAYVSELEKQLGLSDPTDLYHLNEWVTADVFCW